ncbi:LysR family transcriptional regulator [Methylohalobius crimeensis]|uniref:LysR family transcriptional regulator n=1 Tax=Methylohalobius crimeensis TaxID=244365 RepID=UPI0003B52CE7|nr:LysR family transcriptional regulator [Methylohalobius crimeensis]
MDKLTSMRVFARVAQSGSFAAAAKELGVSRAMATKHVMYLENSLGVRLLNRTTRRISLTEAGVAYLERCLQILEDIEETELSVAQLHTEPQGLLRISTPPFFGTFHLAPTVAAYMQQYPKVRVDIDIRGGVVDVVAEGLDLAIRLGELPDSSLIARKLASSPRVVCGAPDYFEKHGRPREPQDLRSHNCLVNWGFEPHDQWRFTGPDGEVSTIRVSGTLQANTADPLRLAAIHGAGLVVLPTYIVGQDLSKGRLEAVLQDHELPAMDIYAVYPHRRHLSAKVRTFLDFLVERLHPIPYWEGWRGV